MSNFMMKIGQQSKKLCQMEKKGQIGRIISTIPVMIFVFIIMGIFVFISFSASALRDPAAPGVESVGNFDILFEKVSVSERDILVLEGIALYSYPYYVRTPSTLPEESELKLRERAFEFSYGLERLAEEKYNERCILLGEGRLGTSFLLKKGILLYSNNDLNLRDIGEYYERAVKIDAKIDERESFIFFYDGECLR